MYWSSGSAGRTRLWQALRAQPPQEICRRSLARAAGEDGFLLRFLNREYAVDPENARIGGPQADLLLEDQELELLLVTYLVQSSELPLSGTWISEKDLPGGSLFFRGPHALPVQPLVRRFGADREAFRRAAAALEGEPLEFADSSFRFPALPRVPAACLLWLADEEFPARVTLLFDRTIERHLPLDVVLALVHCLGLALLAEAGPSA